MNFNISLSAGRPVAVVSNYRGKYDNQIIYISDKPDKERQDPFELLDIEDFLKDPKKFKLLSLEERINLATYLETMDYEEEHKGDNKHIQDKYKQKSEKEFRIDCGNLVVLPDSKPERIFVAGKSGAGKSCWAAMYIREFNEMHPNSNIYLISVHEDDQAYKGLPIIQLTLNEAFINDPPTLEDFRDCLVIFDDVDNLQDKKLSNAVEAVNNDLLANSRKYGTYVLTLHHHLMEYKRTRTLLNESNRVVFYPQGSAYHVQRYLKVYAGVSPADISKIMAEKSRWICLDNGVPMNYITENAVVII